MSNLNPVNILFVLGSRTEIIRTQSTKCAFHPSMGSGAAKSDKVVTSAASKNSVHSAAHNSDIDVVGYGEDCSPEGPLCDAAQYLTCDLVEETCICDLTKGFVHVHDVPGGVELEQELQLEARDAKTSKPPVCISTMEIAKRAENLLFNSNGKANHPENIQNIQESNYEAEFLDDLPDPDSKKPKEQGSSVHKPKLDAETESMFAEALKSFDVLGNKEYDGERLEQFSLSQNAVNLDEVTISDLILDEILKYGKEFVKWKADLIKLIVRHLIWKEHKLASSICHVVFDVDQDDVFTYQEHVIALLSEPLRKFIIPTAFLKLIGPLHEETCISPEDLQELDHHPDSFWIDYAVLDLNIDGCFSLAEFEIAVEEICRANWLTDFLKENGYSHSDLKSLVDPTPEEMYIRRLMQNERLELNWKLLDKDKDGSISQDELDKDFAFNGYTKTESSTMMELLDENGDGQISIEEIKYLISIPIFTENYQFEWLESLYMLYETDEDEVKELLQKLINTFAETKEVKSATRVKENASSSDRIFKIIDKNRNGELDEVEMKLLIELLKKYVALRLVNDTVDLIDTYANRKLSFFDYKKLYINESSRFYSYFRDIIEYLVLEETESTADEEQEYEEYEEENEDGEMQVYLRKVISNETGVMYKIFQRIDINSDGFITPADFYFHVNSFKSKRTPEEVKQDFTALDKDKDGILTSNDSVEIEIPMDFEVYKDHSDPYSDEVFADDLEPHILNMDLTGDGIIQKEEFEIHLRREIMPISNEIDVFYDWIQTYLSSGPSFVDPAAEKLFKEFDSNCDGFVSENEFTSRLEILRQKSNAINYYLKLAGDSSLYFINLDLNEDDKVSYNEFSLLLLRVNKRLDEY